ncbi:SDR family NAD(P)-dependent oxidoreductase [Leifsonia sp. H3M29-4]|uniref:SDR family oxidoreductase n=1 Tax=Salinibacterium metalliresistens TaxID=3031321 RepID=UPI0023D97983|nr:SDR family NAD(P)-dependent oxidoreductase [Salinibacterium metalliresistens]MDF1478110.1 SDR family NAD(P)-dependent oxidoreductase [Salinibacterium metalliresistens]
MSASGALHGRVAVVVGATGWMGRAICREFVESGASLVMVARDEQRLDDLERELAAGDRVLAVAADVTSQLAIDDVRVAAIARFGHIDLVAVLSGVITGSAFDDGIPADWAQMIDVNLRGLLHASQTFADPLLQSARRGLPADLFLLGSVSKETHTPRFAVFNAISSAIKQLSQTLRYEYGPQGLRVHLLQPGFPQPAEDPRGGRSDSPLQPEAIAAVVGLAAALPRSANLAELLIIPTVTE